MKKALYTLFLCSFLTTNFAQAVSPKVLNQKVNGTISDFQLLYKYGPGRSASSTQKREAWQASKRIAKKVAYITAALFIVLSYSQRGKFAKWFKNTSSSDTNPNSDINASEKDEPSNSNIYETEEMGEQVVEIGIRELEKMVEYTASIKANGKKAVDDWVYTVSVKEAVKKAMDGILEDKTKSHAVAISIEGMDEVPARDESFNKGTVTFYMKDGKFKVGADSRGPGAIVAQKVFHGIKSFSEDEFRKVRDGLK